MSSGKNKPIFDKKGICETKGFRGRNFVMTQKTWEDHILGNNSRRYLKSQFDKVIETLESPDYILQSPAESRVVSYVKLFDDLYLTDTVLRRAYLYILVNLNTNIIRTVYDNPKLKKWKKTWPKK